MPGRGNHGLGRRESMKAFVDVEVKGAIPYHYSDELPVMFILLCTLFAAW